MSAGSPAAPPLSPAAAGPGPAAEEDEWGAGCSDAELEAAGAEAWAPPPADIRRLYELLARRAAPPPLAAPPRPRRAPTPTPPPPAPAPGRGGTGRGRGAGGGRGGRGAGGRRRRGRPPRPSSTSRTSPRPPRGGSWSAAAPRARGGGGGGARRGWTRCSPTSSATGASRSSSCGGGRPRPPPAGAPQPPPPNSPPHGEPPGAGGALPNPGAFEECHRRCKELFPVQMEGVKLSVNKGLSNHFQVNHTVALSTVGDSGYHFGATYVGTQQLSPTEAFPVLVGDMDSSGSLNAQVLHQLAPRLRSKLAFQTQQAKFVNWQLDGEYRGADFTAALTLGNPDILVGSGILVAHYLQSVTPALALGAELVYHRRPGEEGAVLSLAGRYTAPQWIGTVTLGQAGAHATYYHRANEQVQVGVELEASPRLQDSSVAFGYQLELPRAHLTFRGSVDSSWVVGAVLEKKLPPLPLTLALGAFLNHRKNKFQCGFGLTIG